MDGELHWNDEIPGKWSLLYFLDELIYGRVLRGNESGVYRLVGLARPRVKVPRVVPRVCDKDVTGTLYIGRGNGRRIQSFAHSLKDWGGRETAPWGASCRRAAAHECCFFKLLSTRKVGDYMVIRPRRLGRGAKITSYLRKIIRGIAA
jgi:hypothetical protein